MGAARRENTKISKGFNARVAKGAKDAIHNTIYELLTLIGTEII